jgi:hypothetical protein
MDAGATQAGRRTARRDRPGRKSQTASDLSSGICVASLSLSLRCAASSASVLKVGGVGVGTPSLPV